MNRREWIWRLAGAAAGVAVMVPATMAQVTPRLPRIGVLRWGIAGDDAQLGLAKALADIGYREKQTISLGLTIPQSLLLRADEVIA